jgi:trehalose/maltose hydrolase-like predicted phosphorylase
MLHHERLRPPSHDYPPDEWNVIEKAFHPEFLAQLETMLALGNGYLGMRGCPEEGGPNAENGTFINGFYETRPIVYGEEAYGFAKTGQTICNVTDSKIIKLFVDDEPFWLPNTHLLNYNRRLNMKSGTLDREILWETPAGKQVSITSQRMISFANRHVAVISYCVTLLNAQAFVVISSEMATNESGARSNGDDPRLARAFSGRVLHPRTSYSKDRRIVLCHATQKSRLTLACATDHALETSSPHSYKVVHTPDFGQVAFTVDARPGCPIQLTKYMVYHTSQTASAEELCGRAEWTMDRVVTQGFQQLLASQEQYMDDFWRRSDVRVKDIREDRTKRSTVEIQQAIRFNLFHILQASARAEDTGVPMLVETARLWLDLGFYSEVKGGKFCVNGVTGPDEYNAVVNNNAYTNLMARENLRYAAQVVESLRTADPDAYNALVDKTALEPSEAKAWIRAAENMSVPYDEKLKIIPQDDNFLDREPWDFRNTPRDHYPLLLFYHPLNIYRKRVIKQADVVLAMFLLGNVFPPETKKRNFEFYDPLTTGDSSLSSCVEAIIAAQTGDMEKAIRYGMAALLMDLADVGGNVKDGCHIASMGGTWMMLTYGFGGMRDDDGTLSFWPRRAPEDNAILRFPLTYRGQRLEIEIGLDKVEYSLREGEGLVIRHEMQEVELTREHPLAVRPVNRW